MSLSPSDISVITVNWNGRSHLEVLLPSLMSLGPGEVIVVDNGSSDGSVEWLGRRFPQVRLLRNESNQGFASPCNQGARAARGRVLAFVNNDMRCHPAWIDAALPELENCACVASRILDWEGRHIDYNGSSLQYLGYAVQQDLGQVAESVIRRGQALFPCGGSMFVHRDVFLSLGGFDADYFAIFEDVDFGWRLWISGHEVRVAPDSVTYHRGHATFQVQSLPKMRYLMHRNALFTIIKNYEESLYRRIVPLAILLALKRAVRCSAVNRESFYLWRETAARALDPEDPRALEELLDAFNHLVSVDDVIDGLPRLLEQRRTVQSRRQRSDSELFALFADPLRPIVLDGDYMETELVLLRGLGLDEVFNMDGFTQALEAAPTRVGERLRSARQELARIQSLGVAAILHPPAVAPFPRSRWDRLVHAWRTDGLRATLVRLWRRMLAF